MPEYTVVDHLPYRPSLEVTDYPKAGDPNPLVTLGVAQPKAGSRSGSTSSHTGSDEILIVNVGWTPDSRRRAPGPEPPANVARSEPRGLEQPRRTLIRETTPAWVNENGNPVWLRDGSFLW